MIDIHVIKSNGENYTFEANMIFNKGDRINIFDPKEYVYEIEKYVIDKKEMVFLKTLPLDDDRVGNIEFVVAEIDGLMSTITIPKDMYLKGKHCYIGGQEEVLGKKLMNITVREIWERPFGVCRSVVCKV